MQRIKASVGAVIQKAEDRLRAAGVDEPRLVSETIVAAAMGCPRLELFTRFNERLAPGRLAGLDKKIRRLEKHEPLQYVLGGTEFMGRKFKCDSRALIPRPETEELVELAINHEPLWRLERPAIIDIGTGTGCIVVSLALSRQNAKYFAADISAGAIDLARQNARLHKCLSAIKFMKLDLAGAQMPVGLDAVIANPPYVRRADFSRLDRNVRLWEPRLALDGGADGLRVIRPLVKKAFQILKPGRWLFMEIGAGQWPAVEGLILSAGFRQCAVRRDQAGHARMAIAVK